jgi:hypothetical protein
MKRVIIESPYAGDIEKNTTYARRAMRDSIGRGEAPLARHLLYTQPGILDENNPAERQLGIAAGLSWAPVCQLHVFYTDLGWSRGMKAAYAAARANGWPFALRAMDGEIRQPEE